jgi:hypothetical protein
MKAPAQARFDRPIARDPLIEASGVVHLASPDLPGMVGKSRLRLDRQLGPGAPGAQRRVAVGRGEPIGGLGPE